MKNEVGEPPASAPAAPGTEAEILASGGTCTPHYEFSNGPLLGLRILGFN